MIGAVKRVWDNFRGSGDAAVTVPPMDGALRPNRMIEEAPAIAAADAPDNLVSDGARTLFSSGGAVLELGAGTASEVVRFACDVTALALSPDGALAIGLDDGRIVIDGGSQDGKVLTTLAARRSVCPTALLFTSAGELVVAQGSASRPPREWKHDIMERGATGSVWRVSLAEAKAQLMADRLSWPNGLIRTASGAIAVSESGRHRVAIINGKGDLQPVLADLPGYPARLAPATGGGYWLAVFAPRSPLIEFVQREPEFRRRMMADIDPAYWAAPSLVPSSTFLEPLQGGAQIHLGMLKPWAPTRSYGLVIRLDDNFRPLDSFHSRADGKRHGITSCVEVGGKLLATSKGGNVIVALDSAARSSGKE